VLKHAILAKLEYLKAVETSMASESSDKKSDTRELE
jgi:hypothetical protein